MENYKMLIGGSWLDSSSGSRFETENPFTEKVWATLPRATVEDANKAVEAAHAALKGAWSAMSATARGALLRRLGDLIAENATSLAETEVRDNGKLLTEMSAQVRYAPQFCYFFGGLADKIQGSVPAVDRPGHFLYTRREPLGVVVAITPWNSPILLTIAKLAPALAAGCTVVLKPSEYASASTIEFARLIEAAGFPAGVVNVVTGYGGEIGPALVSHPKVARVAFTGGEFAGRKIGELSGRYFKHVSLELGGKSPNIVFDDADMDQAVKGVVSGIFAASGQTCLAGSRLLLQDTIYDEFVGKLVEFASTASLGDPRDARTQVGPVTTRPQYERILRYIETAKKEGAVCVLGGGPAKRGGLFVQPTIFKDVTNEMTIAREEVFGPVLSIIRFKDLDDAVNMANDSNFGLAAGIWTKDMNRAFTASQRLEAGTVWVNTYRVASVLAPFGGYKQSGLGRENGIEAVESYLQTKTVWMNYGAEIQNPFVIRI